MFDFTSFEVAVFMGTNEAGVSQQPDFGDDLQFVASREFFIFHTSLNVKVQDD